MRSFRWLCFNCLTQCSIFRHSNQNASPVNIQRVTLKMPPKTYGGLHVTWKVHFDGECVNDLHISYTIRYHVTKCLLWSYANGSIFRSTVRVNSTDLQGGEYFLWHPKALWSQQVICEVLSLILRTFSFFNNGQRKLITDKWILYWRKTIKAILKMAALYRLIHLTRVYI